MKVELLQEHTRDKVRRRFTLSVTTRLDGMTGQAATGSGNGRWTWLLSLSASHLVGATITVVPRDNNKMTNGSGECLEWVVGPNPRYLHVG